MRRSMMWHAHLAERVGGVMETDSGAAKKQGSVTVFLRMGDVSHF